MKLNATGQIECVQTFGEIEDEVYVLLYAYM